MVNRKFKDQAPVVQRLDSAIHRISIGETNCTIHLIEIYPVDSAIQPFNNRGLISGCDITCFDDILEKMKELQEPQKISKLVLVNPACANSRRKVSFPAA